MNIFSQKTEAFGLDISDFSLKLAKLKKIGDGLKLASFGEAEVPPGIIEGGEVKDENALARVIKNCLTEVKGERHKSKYVISSLPEEKSFLDVLQLPLVKEEELESTVRFEAENHIPLALDEAYFDFEKIPLPLASQKYQEILFAATPKKIVDAYLSALKKAGLQVLAMEVECLSVVRALVEQNKVHGPLLLIDFGESRTSFVIFSGRSLRFTSTIPIASRGLTEAIAKNLKIDFAKAEDLKLKQGIGGEKNVSGTMLSLLADLVTEIKNHLTYYHSHTPKEQLSTNGKRLEKILLCGGGANLKGLVDFLSSSLRAEVELGNPWVNILEQPLKEVPELPFEKSLGYTTALGLALRAIDKR